MRKYYATAYPASEDSVKGSELLTENRVWLQLIGSLTKIRSVFAENKKISEGLKTFTLRLVEAATERIGWDFKQTKTS